MSSSFSLTRVTTVKNVRKFVSDLKMSHRLRCDEHSTERVRFYQTYIFPPFLPKGFMGMITQTGGKK